MIVFNILLVTKKVRLLNRYVLLPQMSGYIKYFENGVKKVLNKDDDVLDKYNKIWNNIKKTLEIYIKAKVREFNSVIKTKFLSYETTKENFILHLHSAYNY